MAAGPFDEATHKFMHGTGLPPYLVQLQRRYSQDVKSPNTSQFDSSLTCMWMIVHAACMFMHPSKSWPSLVPSHLLLMASCEMVICWPFEVHRVIGCISCVSREWFGNAWQPSLPSPIDAATLESADCFHSLRLRPPVGSAV